MDFTSVTLNEIQQCIYLLYIYVSRRFPEVLTFYLLE